MKDIDASLVNIVQDIDTNKINAVHMCCKGKCDYIIQNSTGENKISAWKDLKDFTNPYLYLKHIMAVLNSMNKGEGFENEEAFQAYKNLLIKMYPYVSRNMNEKEKQAISIAEMFEF